jgi:site-specific recombinase XerD
MTNELITTSQEGAEVTPAPALDQVREYVRASKAANTLRGYQTDWRAFIGWCGLQGFVPLPADPETVASYIAASAQHLKVGSLQRILNAITEAHRAVNLEPPTHAPLIVNLMKGVRRLKGIAPLQKAPTLIDDVRAMIAATDDGLIGVRDRALVLVGFAGAFRRSELVGLNIEDCQFNRDGLTVTLRRSKTDQNWVGRSIGIPYGSHPTTCPVRALQDWIAGSAITTGPLFRSVNRHGRLQAAGLSGQTVALLVKKLATRAGLDPTSYSGQSLRAGHVTAAILGGAAEHVIQRQTGHKSTTMLRRYFRDADLFRQNSGSKLGL